jgi:hypothetical protein
VSAETQITGKPIREKQLRNKHTRDKQLGDKQLRDQPSAEEPAVAKRLSEKQIGEKRRESRRPADGLAHVEFSNPRPVKIQGRLMDVSSSGFRMAHSYTSLAAGQVVDFAHSEARGSARVMWNRILDRRVETGFLVVAV